MSKFKILLIEDHLSERLNVLKVLKEFDIELDSAVTFHRARDLVANKTYDLVISEVLLSHASEKQGDGVQFAEFLRNHYPYPLILLLADESLKKITETVFVNQVKPKILIKPTCHEALKKALVEQMQWVEKLTA